MLTLYFIVFVFKVYLKTFFKKVFIDLFALYEMNVYLEQRYNVML